MLFILDQFLWSVCMYAGELKMQNNNLFESLNYFILSECVDAHYFALIKRFFPNLLCFTQTSSSNLQTMCVCVCVCARARMCMCACTNAHEHACIGGPSKTLQNCQEAVLFSQACPLSVLFPYLSCNFRMMT